MSAELMTIAAARELATARNCFVGVGRPSTAALLARRVHAPDLVLIYESGTIGAKPDRVPLSIGDGELAETADTVVSVPEIFNYWLQPGRIEVAFLGAAQLDRLANINTTVIGDYHAPRARLPGAGGAPEIASAAQRVVVIVPHTRRSFVEHLDFTTSVGSGDGPDTRRRLGFSGAGVDAVITDLGILRPDPATRELRLVAVHPGIEIEQAVQATGWPLAIDEELTVTPAPTPAESEALRVLEAESERAPA